MDLKTYIDDMPRRLALADELGSSPGYLQQIATGWRGKRASSDFAIRVEEATRKLTPRMVVRKGDLRPDLWPLTKPRKRAA